MAITSKKYQCPVCFTESIHSTNHFSEIYSGCKTCGNSVLTCIEDQAYKLRESLPQTHAMIKFYRFDVSDKPQKEAYKALTKALQSQGKSKFSSRCYNRFMSELKQGACLVTVWNPSEFDNQFVTSRGRLFTWYEAVYPNKDIKEGYYLYLQGQEGY